VDGTSFFPVADASAHFLATCQRKVEQEGMLGNQALQGTLGMAAKNRKCY